MLIDGSFGAKYTACVGLGLQGFRVTGLLGLQGVQGLGLVSLALGSAFQLNSEMFSGWVILGRRGGGGGTEGQMGPKRFTAPFVPVGGIVLDPCSGFPADPAP